MSGEELLAVQGASPQGKMGLGRDGGKCWLCEEAAELVLPLLRDRLAVQDPSLAGRVTLIDIIK